MEFTWQLLATFAVLIVVSAAFILRSRPTKKGAIKAMYLYPIKSTYGIEVQSAEVGQYGFKYDREWMLVDQTNNFISQRVHPKMALIKTAINEAKGVLDVSAPGKSSIEVPLKHVEGEELDVTVWGGDMRGVHQGQAISDWFSDYLGAQVRLVRLPIDHDRVVEQKFSVSGADLLCSFADGFPYLLANENSLEVVRNATLAECGDDPVTIRRFRPNIVLSGFEAWDELLFERAQVGKTTMFLSKPCTRCKLTTVIPDKGTFGGEQPLQYIRNSRKSIFGMNAIHTPSSKGKIVSVGDSVTVDRFRSQEIQM